ncbi:hypothetical protein PEC18_12150 [Paucibacter sp. O1-1]|nr:hypothetical protein [Paucibacter sp. O1-1]MDA3826568.1 hypothetical protein [Paucibacter sp. O1-1]
MAKKIKPLAISPIAPVARLMLAAMESLQATHEPAMTFKLSDRDTEFTVTLKRIDGRRVLSKAETLLMLRVKQGHQDLDPAEIRIARRILAKQR